MIPVNTDEICAAIKDIFEDTRGIAEPAGALGVAGLTRWSRAPARATASWSRSGGEPTSIASVTSASAPRPGRTPGAAGGPHSGGERQLPALLRRARQPCDHQFNYRYSVESPTADIFVGLKVSAGDADRRALIASL